MSITCIFFVSLTFDKLIAFQLFVELHSLSTQEHYMSAKEMRKLLCEFINNILTDLDAGEQRTLRWGGEGQGPKLTFLGRRQVATEIFFFSRHMEKCGRQKVSIKFFLRSETQTKIFGCQMENSGRQFFF